MHEILTCGCVVQKIPPLKNGYFDSCDKELLKVQHLCSSHKAIYHFPDDVEKIYLFECGCCIGLAKTTEQIDTLLIPYERYCTKHSSSIKNKNKARYYVTQNAQEKCKKIMSDAEKLCKKIDQIPNIYEFDCPFKDISQ